MKTAIVTLLLLGAVISPVLAQVHVSVAKEAPSSRLEKRTVDPASGIAGAYPICGSVLLHDQEQAVLQYIAQHPEAELPRLGKANAWGFTVGSTHAWYAHNYVTSSEYLTNSTCRGVGTHCYVFVEDSMWTSGRVDSSVVDSVMNAFDNAVPANASKGVYQMDVDAFGNPPDVDGDPRIILLILNIRDGWTGGGYIMGYFYGLNEINTTGSNNAEIYYLDANPTNLKSSAGLQDGMSTTAHEFQHMIHWNYNKSQISFVNEGCSLVAEVNCGYPIYEQFFFANQPNHYLLDWRSNDLNNVLYDYSRAARYFTYLRDQYGMGIFAPIVQNGTLKGINSISYGLSQAGSARLFNDVYLDWEVANTLDDRTVDPKFGYLYPGLPKPVSDEYLNPNLPATIEWVQPLAVKYVTFGGGANLLVTETTTSSSIVAKYVEFGTPSVVGQLTSGVQFSEPGFGSTYKTVTLALMNTSTTDSQQVTIQASGVAPTAVELAYEHTEPEGFLGLTDGDTASVLFDGVTGARLDSIRVALRRALPITGGVWSFGAVGHILGAPLCPAFTATGPTNPSAPYPVPWPNWVTVDLRSYSIDASNPFAVAFAYVGSGTTGQRIMISGQPVSAGIHSYTYYQESGSPGWFYLTTNSAGDSAWAYLIRAYVSFGSTSAQPSQELLPTATRLEQNYPNPFNPGTVLRFELAKAGEVRLTVLDVLGREVAELFNGRQNAGTHTFSFNGTRLASGVYFYRLETPGLVQVKKMTLVR
ncbi:MAG: T9SS type A sorting domain-containing protein [Bacteroidota bacterium]